jgi:hypothetical protein
MDSKGQPEMPDLKTHYAIMDAQEESVRRIAPIPIVLYHLYLKTVHSGLTVQEVLSLPDEAYARFTGEGFEVNCCAALFPYEQDFVPGVAISFFDGFGLTLTAVPTEDMVSLRLSLCFVHGLRLSDVILAGLATLAGTV